MIVYIIGGLIGLIFFKSKYNLSFWSAVSYGVTLGFGLYFGFGAITSLFTLITGVEDASDSVLYFFVFSGLTALCFWIVSKAKKRSQVIENAKSQSITQPIAVSNTINIPRNKVYGLGDEVETRLAGVTFEGRQAFIRNATVGQTVKIKREPDNSYDPNAISVCVRDDDFASEDNDDFGTDENYKIGEEYPYDDIDKLHGNEEIIGYINRDLAKELAPLFDEQNEEYVYGDIISIYHAKNDHSILGVEVKFRLPGDDYEYEGDVPF